MKQYVIDLTLEPEERWLVVDPKPIQALVEAAEEELLQVCSKGSLKTIETIAKVGGFLYRNNDLVRELRGLAEHTGVSFEKLYLMNLSYDLAACGFGIPGMLGCTAALVEGNIARTMDWAFPSSVVKHTTLYRFRSETSEVLSVGFPGFVGIVSGLSSHGVAITLNQAFYEQLPHAALPVPWLIRRVLEECPTYDKAMTMIAQTPAASSGFYLVSDGLNGALIESTGDTDTVFTSDGPLFVANHFHDDEKPDDEDREWGDSHARHDVLEFAICSDVGLYKALETEPVQHGATAHQIILFPQDMAMKVRCPNNPRPHWETFSCQSQHR